MFAPEPHKLAFQLPTLCIVCITSERDASHRRSWSDGTLPQHCLRAYDHILSLPCPLAICVVISSTAVNCLHCLAGSVPEQHMHALLVEDKLAQTQSYVDWMTQLHKTVMAKA